MIHRLLRSGSFQLLLLAAVLAANWYALAYLLDRYERYRAENYFKEFETRLQAARQELQLDRADGIAALEELIEDLPWTRNYARINSVYRQAFRLLTDTLVDSGRPRDALRWAVRWTQFDPLSMRGRLSKARLLYTTGRQPRKGIRLLEALTLEFPANPAVTDAYLEVLLDRGEIGRAVAAVKRYVAGLPEISRSPWRIFWDGGGGFNARHSAAVRPRVPSSGRLRLEAALPPGVRRLRIDPPAFLPLLLSTPRLTLVTAGGTLPFDSRTVPVELHQMAKADDTFCTTGGNDPFAVWRLPDQEGRGITGMRFTAAVYHYFPRQALHVLEKASLQDTASAAQSPDLAALLEKIRRSAAVHGGCPAF